MTVPWLWRERELDRYRERELDRDRERELDRDRYRYQYRHRYYDHKCERGIMMLTKHDSFLAK